MEFNRTKKLNHSACGQGTQLWGSRGQQGGEDLGLGTANGQQDLEPGLLQICCGQDFPEANTPLAGAGRGLQN